MPNVAHNAIDLAGRRVGRWMVIERALRRSGTKLLYWKCVCECGTTKEVYAGSLRRGLSRSCGCLQQEVRRANGKKSRTHGLSSSRTYISWAAMRSRCNRKSDQDWHKYGGAGITVCSRWQGSFENFLADMGERPSGCTIDRVNPRLGYEPGNCRWATARQQARNQRVYYRNLTAFGSTKPIQDWAAEFGIGQTTIRERLCRGWTVEEAISIPPLRKGRDFLYANAARQQIHERTGEGKSVTSMPVGMKERENV